MSSLDTTDITVAWSLTGAAALLTAGRYTIRYFFTQLVVNKWTLADDGFHLASLIALIIFDATNQTHNSAKLNLDASSANPATPQADILSGYYNLLALSRANNCFLYLVFWLVKFSFLLFYRSLFDVSSKFRKAWWVVLAYTFLSFWGPLGGVLATCAGASSVLDFVSCNDDKFFRQQKLSYTCFFVVSSDAAIMALPLWMIKDLKMRIGQKLGLVFVFSFALVEIVLDILRTVEAIDLNQALFTILETNFAVIICCLPTYRVLLNLNQIKLNSCRGRSGYGSNLSRSSKAIKLMDTINHTPMSKDDDDLLKSDIGHGSTSITSDSIRYGKSSDTSIGDRDPYVLEAQNHEKAESDPTQDFSQKPFGAHAT
ncbi:hypothetical protein MMC13_006413 [Lambiella insularis]|nr:hypothetical protein [Lambiella insularis]